MTDPPGSDTPGEVTFGISLYTGQHAPGSTGQWYGEAAALAEASEAAGFDTFWVSEHHGFSDGYLPSPLTLLAAIAERTTAIRLGTGLLLGPLRHPVKLAEDACVVDQLSRGRLVLGLGAGYHLAEFDMLGVDAAGRGRRLTETVEILRRCWQGERFSYHGTVHSLDGVRVSPTPFRAGGIPIWLGGYAPAALERAARLADGHLVGRGDPEIVQASADLVQRALQGDPRPFTFGLNVTVVLTDPGGHPASALEGFAYQQRTYERMQQGTDVYAGRITTDADGSDAAAAAGGLALGTIDRYVHAHGSGEDLVEALLGYVRRLSGWPQLHVALRALFPERDPRHQQERIARLGADVLGPLRRRLATERRGATSRIPTGGTDQEMDGIAGQTAGEATGKAMGR